MAADGVFGIINDMNVPIARIAATVKKHLFK
jgi:hypothetical protein